MIIKVSSKFEKEYTHLSKRIKEKAKEKETIFRQNPFDSQLKTHKLSGKDKNCWAFYITRSYRIKFSFLSNKEILFLEIGSHSIYK